MAQVDDLNQMINDERDGGVLMPRMSANQEAYVAYVRNHPGCSVADVDRACRINPQAGHKWVYDGVARLIKRGILRSEWEGRCKKLYADDIQ